MRDNLIYLTNYVIIVSEDTPKKDFEGYYYLGSKIFNTSEHTLQTGCKEVLLHYPLNNSPILKNVPLIPNFILDNESI